MSHRFEGRNLEEALQSASQSLGVDRWQLTYHVLLEKRGFLGGMKRVVIEADVNAGAAPPAPQAPAVPAPAPVAAVDEERPARPARSGPDRMDRPMRDHSASRGGAGDAARGGTGDAPRGGSGGGGGRGGRGGRGRGGSGGGGRRRDTAGEAAFAPVRDQRRRRETRHDDELQPGDFEKFLEADVPEQGAESDAAKVVRTWCERVIELSRLSLVVRTEENETQIIVRLFGSDSGRLVDRNGELLDAIQVLANKALVGRKVEKEIELDSEQFKDRRTGDLQKRAREVAERVRSEGGEELLPAMTPIERRIVHLALQDDKDVTTESRGEGFYKRVAIIPRPEGPAEPAGDQPAGE